MQLLPGPRFTVGSLLAASVRAKGRPPDRHRRRGLIPQSRVTVPLVVIVLTTMEYVPLEK